MPHQVVGCDGHGEDFDAQMLGLVHSVLQAPAGLLVALQGVSVSHHDQVLILLQVGAPAGCGGGETTWPSLLRPPLTLTAQGPIGTTSLRPRGWR